MDPASPVYSPRSPGDGVSTANAIRTFSAKKDGNNVAWRGIQDLWERRLLCDTTLIAEGERFQVHRCYLASCSEYFCTMFTGSFRESTEDEVPMPGLTQVGLNAILTYIYTGKVEITQETLTDILDASSHLQVMDVKEFCGEYLGSVITLENCIQYHDLAELYGLTVVKMIAINFMLNNFESVVQREELSVDLLSYLLASNQLQESEFHVFKGVMTWLNQLPGRHEYAERVLKQIRFWLFTPEEMREVYSDENCDIMMQDSCRHILRDALNYHMNVFKQPIINTYEALPRSHVDALILFGEKGVVPMGETARIFLGNVHEFTSIASPTSSKGAAIAVIRYFIFVVGGEKNPKSAFRYNATDGKWMQLASMETPRYDYALAALSDSLMAVGGADSSELSSCTDLVEQYSFNENKWFQTQKLDRSLHKHAACTIGDRVYVSGGGYHTEGKPYITKEMRCFDVKTRVWQVKSPMNQARTFHSMVTYNSNIYVCGGGASTQNCVANIMHTEMYNVEQDQWTILAPIGHCAVKAGAAHHRNFLFILGGIDWNNKQSPNSIIQRYDLDKNKWSVLKTKLTQTNGALIASSIKLPYDTFNLIFYS